MRNQMLLNAITTVLQWAWCTVAVSTIYLCGLAPRSLELGIEFPLAFSNVEAAMALSAGGAGFAVGLPLISAACLLLTTRLVLPYGQAVSLLRRGASPGSKSASRL